MFWNYSYTLLYWAYCFYTVLCKGDSGGGNGISGDGGSDRNHLCNLKDGRSIPVGQKFNYVHNGERLMCTCPKTSSGNMVKVECTRDIEGK